MPVPIKMFLGFVIGFGLLEGGSAWYNGDAVALGPLVADVVGPAAIAALLYWSFERFLVRAEDG